MSRADTLYVSARETTRTFFVQLRMLERRKVALNLNGVLPDGVTISSVSWVSFFQQSVVQIEDQGNDDRTCFVWLRARWLGFNWVFGNLVGGSLIEARIVLSDGSELTERVEVRVR